MNTSSGDSDKIEQTVVVPVTADRAFKTFVEELDSWWPAEYTWSGNKLENIAIEPYLNGRCFERGPHGFTCDWGRVLEMDPPNRILFTWQIGPDRVPEPNPDKSSEIEVVFRENESETLVQFVHRNFHKHGENGQGYKEALSSPEGWPFILNRFKEAIK